MLLDKGLGADIDEGKDNQGALVYEWAHILIQVGYIFDQFLHLDWLIVEDEHVIGKLW